MIFKYNEMLFDCAVINGDCDVIVENSKYGITKVFREYIMMEGLPAVAITFKCKETNDDCVGYMLIDTGNIRLSKGDSTDNISGRDVYIKVSLKFAIEKNIPFAFSEGKEDVIFGIPCVDKIAYMVKNVGYNFAEYKRISESSEDLKACVIDLGSYSGILAIIYNKYVNNKQKYGSPVLDFKKMASCYKNSKSMYFMELIECCNMIRIMFLSKIGRNEFIVNSELSVYRLIGGTTFKIENFKL